MDNFIRKIVWSFSTSTNLEYDDLFQEAYLAYLEALKSYDPLKGRITTYMWHCLHNRLKNYIKEQQKESQYILPLDCLESKAEEIGEFGEEGLDRLDNLPCEETHPYFEDLSNVAQQIVNVVMETPMDFMFLKKNEINKEIQKTLSNKGWELRKIFAGLKDLQTAYS